MLEFHKRSISGQHLFAVKGDCKVVSGDEVETDSYKNVNTTEMYLTVDIDTSSEIDSLHIDSTKKEFVNKTRYDAQYSTIEFLKK